MNKLTDCLLSVTMNVDFIIIGQGLAGTLLAYELLNQNKTLVIFDDPSQAKASEVAAGLINPVVFRRMIKSWHVDDAFPQMETTYRRLEGLLKEKLYYPSRMMKVLNEGETVFWKEKVFTNNLEDYLDAEPCLNFKNKAINHSFSFGCVNKAGRLDIQKLISSFSEFLNQQDWLRKENFDFEKLTFNANLVCYNEITTQKVIFCEGPAVSENPYFSELKFKHSKGETLEVRSSEVQLNEIISSEVFIMPLGEDRYKVGATYRWDELNWETTSSAREELLSKLKNCISAPFEIIDQKAGIRPTMHDRKPVIGIHPEYPQIAIFNGLGSKGVLLGPCFARQLAEYLVGNSDYILPEADIKRYFKRK